MKKQVKILTTILMVVMLLTTLAGVVFADDQSKTLLSSLTGDSSGVTTTNIQGFGNRIIAIVRVIGVVVAVVILLVLGIKYMLGSAEEKAEYKKSMIPYIVGAILIFASTTIVGMVYDLANSLNQ